MNRIIIGLLAILFSFDGLAQHNSSNASKVHMVSFKTQFIQIKDAFNYDLVFSGPNLVAAYSFSKNTNKDLIRFSPEIAFGGVFNKGAGFAWRFKPIDLYYGRKLSSKPFTIGAYLATDYQWQQYSELQGGRLFWFSTIEVGPKIEYVLPYQSGLLNFSFSNSLAGFSSRPEPSTESYYYDFSFSEFISVANQNLSFGSFNRAQFEMTLEPNSWKRLSIAYSFEYFTYTQETRLSFISHSLNFNWKI